MSIGTMIFYSAIQAELKAQYPDQEFVNRASQTDEAQHAILVELYSHRKQIRPKKMKYFIICCEALSQRLAYKDLSEEDLVIAAKLLQDRYNKVISNPAVLAQIPSQMAEWRLRLEDFVNQTAAP